MERINNTVIFPIDEETREQHTPYLDTSLSTAFNGIAENISTLASCIRELESLVPVSSKKTGKGVER